MVQSRQCRVSAPGRHMIATNFRQPDRLMLGHCSSKKWNVSSRRLECPQTHSFPARSCHTIPKRRHLLATMPILATGSLKEPTVASTLSRKPSYQSSRHTPCAVACIHNETARKVIRASHGWSFYSGEYRLAHKDTKPRRKPWPPDNNPLCLCAFV